MSENETNPNQRADSASTDEYVDVVRPDGKPSRITRAAFRGIYQYRGWKLADDKPARKTTRKRTTRKKAS